MDYDVIVVGAGIAGLQCARVMKSKGAKVLVVDRGSRPGGRCATRTIEGCTVDYGPLFLHGNHPRFVNLIESLPEAGLIAGWPFRIEGHGTPCQPVAFDPGETRLAYSKGVGAFPLALASGLDIRLKNQIENVIVRDGFAAVKGIDGEQYKCRYLVLALALDQTPPFLRMLPASRERDSALALISLFASLPTLTVVAGYEKSVTWPDWDISYPDTRSSIMLIGNESKKRPDQNGGILVYQATSAWSVEHLDDIPETWSRALLGDAVKLLGTWAGTPSWTHLHRWRFGRVAGGNELAESIIIRFGDVKVGLAGDVFSPGAGVQAAWLSGDRLAERLSKE